MGTASGEAGAEHRRRAAVRTVTTAFEVPVFVTVVSSPSHEQESRFLHWRVSHIRCHSEHRELKSDSNTHPLTLKIPRPYDSFLRVGLEN